MKNPGIGNANPGSILVAGTCNHLKLLFQAFA